MLRYTLLVTLWWITGNYSHTFGLGMQFAGLLVVALLRNWSYAKKFNYSIQWIISKIYFSPINVMLIELCFTEQPGPESFVCDDIFVDCIVSNHLLHRTSQVSEGIHVR